MAEEKKRKKPFKHTLGRPAIDWELLYQDWMSSNMPKRDFLLQYGLLLSSGNVKRKTQHWDRGVAIASHNLLEADRDKSRPPKEIAGLWQVVQQWRGSQCENDYKLADAMRSHVKLILNQSIRKTDLGTESKLKPHELRALTEALKNLQMIQRLALGMSTENVGHEHHIEEQARTDGEDDCPVFIVEVNDNGRFVRPRPRRVN